MLRQRLISAVAVVLAAAIPIFFGGAVFAIAMLVVAVLSLREIFNALHWAGHRPFSRLGYLTAAVLIGNVAWLGFGWSTSLTILLSLILILVAGILRPDPAGALLDWALSLATTLYVGLGLATAVAMRNLEGEAGRAWVTQVAETLGSGPTAVGLSWVGFALAVTWLTDSAAYLGGRRFGRTKLAPRLSPGKTRQGAIAGLLVGTLAGAAGAPIFGAPVSPLLGAAIGLALSATAQFGDLAESLIKRNLGVKDMGSLIPGHGGAMDRIDALLFTFPLAYLIAILIGGGR